MISQPMPVNDAQLYATCQPGKGAVTCRFLTFGPSGWMCAKGSDLEPMIIARGETMKAQGDHCSGFPNFAPTEVWHMIDHRKDFDEGKISTTDGAPPVHFGSPAPNPTVEANGQHKSYWVLSEAERAKGFVRPVRTAYVHTKCGSVTTMGLALAETYARQPDFYGQTFCCACRGHFRVGEHGEFTWDGTTEKVGT